MDYQSVTRIYEKLREILYHVIELEGGKLLGEIELGMNFNGSVL